MEKTYEIKGMKCQGCQKTITEKFQEVPGVQKVEVDLENKTATVNGEVTQDALQEGLKGTKFEVIA